MKPVQESPATLPSTPASASWVIALRAALVLILLCGGLYPLVTVMIGGTLFPGQATGSLIERDGVVVGSALVGQPFSAPGYFHGRPSAAGYDPFSVSGSNWAASNPALRERAEASSLEITTAEGISTDAVPVDLISASGSGIDPHISPEAAAIQIGRVAAMRGLPRAAVAALVESHIERPTLGVLGQPRVNVLLLNLALDELTTKDQP